MEPTGGDRRAVGREEFALLQKMFSERFDAHEKLDDARFAAQEKIGLERHEAVRVRLETVAKNVHDLRSDLTVIFALPERVAELVRDLDNVPRKVDLDHQTQTLTMKIDGIETARKDAAVRARWAIGLAVTLGLPLAMLVFQALFKKFGLL